MQELLNYTTDLLHTFDSEQRVAMAVLDYLKTNKKALLEKEKEVIVRSFMNVSNDKDTRLEDVHLREFAEQYYNETFKTKQR